MAKVLRTPGVYIVSVGNYNAKPMLADFNVEIVMNDESSAKGPATLQKEPEPTLISSDYTLHQTFAAISPLYQSIKYT